MYNDTVINQIKEIGAAHMMSKIKTAPWVGLSGEFEPGAQRWVHYDCNVLGDPALKVWTKEPNVGLPENPESVAFSIFPNPCKDQLGISFTLSKNADIRISLINALGQTILTSLYPSQKTGTQLLNINLPAIEPGIYSLRMEDGLSAMVKKVIIIR
jgi:hypothetical protein